MRHEPLHPSRLALRRSRGLRRPLRRAQLSRLQAKRRRALREPALYLSVSSLRWEDRLPLGPG